MSKKNDKTFWQCNKCGQKFAKIMNKNKILLLGPTGQEIEVGFYYAKLICNKCGTENILNLHLSCRIINDIDELKYFRKTSDKYAISDLEKIADQMYPINKAFFDLSPHFRNQLLKKLSFWESEVYRWLIDNSHGEDIEGIYVHQKIPKISKSLKLKPEIINQHIGKIIREILLLQPKKLTNKVKKFLEFKKEIEENTDIKSE